jgi:hypothetical protein
VKAPHSFERFSDAQWTEISQARKDWPSAVDWAQIRTELEQMGRDYWAMHDRRAGRPSQDERNRLYDLLERTKDVETAFPRLGQELKTAIEPAHRLMLAWIAMLEVWSSRYFRRRSDAHRMLLELRLRLLWMGPLGGKWGSSRNRYDEVTGPLVRFLEAVFRPILGSDAPTREGIRKIIKREQKVLERHANFWRTVPERRLGQEVPEADLPAPSISDWFRLI